ncbi:MAG: leucine-rich repeat protein [Clostridia bacterium]|nr:leucine-rich repeat protein [Clostridia bacterium]
MGSFEKTNAARQCPCCGNTTSFIKRSEGYLCEHCGFLVEPLPDQTSLQEQDNEIHARILQGHEYLHNYDFERARNTFQRIMQDAPANKHAYWGFLLAKFGVVYVKGFFSDEAEPIYCFPDYDHLGKTTLKSTKEFAKILELVGEDTKLQNLYFEQAKKIDQAIINFRKSVDRAEDDVFLCVKISRATEADPEAAGHTEDSAIAEQIERELTDRGLKVFYSLHTLTNQVDSDDQIWSHLVKSKKMILIGTREDYLESAWVKSEWMRWLYLNRQEQLYVYVPKRDVESPKSILPYELRTKQIYTLDSYEKLLRDVSDMSNAAAPAPDDMNGRIVFINGNEEIIPYGTEEISPYAYSGRTDVFRVILPEGIKRICNEAFAGCDKMVEVKLPDSLQLIGEEAFRGCDVLKEIDIPYRTQTIGVQAFLNCRSLESITIPANTVKIGYGAFGCCDLLKEMSVDKRNKNYYGNGNCIVSKNGVLVVGCASTRIPDDDSVVTIGQNAFCGCAELFEIDLPDSVQTIEDGAFLNCRNLERISLPSSITEIGTDAFRGCNALKTVNYDSSEWVWKGIDCGKGNEWLMQAYRNTQKKQKKPEAAEQTDDREYLENVESVGRESFVDDDSEYEYTEETKTTETEIMEKQEESTMIVMKSKALENLEAELAVVRRRLEDSQRMRKELEESLEDVKQKQAELALTAEQCEYRQTECLNRANQAASEKIVAEKNEASAKENKARAIREMELKAQVEAEARAAELAARARAEAAAREKEKASLRVQEADARVNSAKEEINQKAREEYEAREQALAAEQEKAAALEECKRLDDDVSYNQDYLDLNAAMEKKTQAKIDDLLARIRREMAKDNPSSEDEQTTTTTVTTTTTTTTTTGSGAKTTTTTTTKPGTTTVKPKTTVSIPETSPAQTETPAVPVGAGYILYTDGRKQILKNGMTSIANYAYQNNDTIAIVVLPKTLKRIGEYAFAGCTNLTTVTMFDSVNEIGKYAFDKCTKLSIVQLTQNIAEIARCTFQKCESLKKIDIPYGVKKIDVSAFNMCKNLETVTLPETLTYIGERAFFGCLVGTDIVPGKNVFVGREAFGS